MGKVTIEIDEEVLKRILSENYEGNSKGERIEPSEYARFFDVDSTVWRPDGPEYNLMLLKEIQDYANVLLRNQGFVFLNDVYKLLGLSCTKMGQVVGWIYDEECPKGDNFIDFGIYENTNHKSINGAENSFLLDFNVDGNILNYL